VLVPVEDQKRLRRVTARRLDLLLPGEEPGWSMAYLADLAALVNLARGPRGGPNGTRVREVTVNWRSRHHARRAGITLRETTQVLDVVTRASFGADEARRAADVRRLLYLHLLGLRKVAPIDRGEIPSVEV